MLPERGDALWPAFSPYDQGSDLANLAVFLRPCARSTRPTGHMPMMLAPSTHDD